MGGQGEPGGPCVSVSEGPDQGKELHLDEAGRAYVMGRGKGLDMVLDDIDASRRHVEVVRRADQVTVRDLGSKNGATLGDQRLDAQGRAWKQGQDLRAGSNTFVFRYPALDALGDLERAADEKIRADEAIPPPQASIPPPRPGSVPPKAKGGARSVPHLEGGAPVEIGGAPIAEVPRRVGADRRRPSGWNRTDFLVVLLALGVLAVSVVGLYWLLRG
jgi:hypothetical protein